MVIDGDDVSVHDDGDTSVRDDLSAVASPSPVPELLSPVPESPRRSLEPEPCSPVSRQDDVMITTTKRATVAPPPPVYSKLCLASFPNTWPGDKTCPVILSLNFKMFLVIETNLLAS